MSSTNRCPLCPDGKPTTICNDHMNLLPFVDQVCDVCELPCYNWPAVQSLKDRLTVEGIAPLIAEYLTDVNADHDTGDGIMFIPPTAIPWPAAGAAKRIVDIRRSITLADVGLNGE